MVSAWPEPPSARPAEPSAGTERKRATELASIHRKSDGQFLFLGAHCYTLRCLKPECIRLALIRDAARRAIHRDAR
jgi:hypothetical protein